MGVPAGDQLQDRTDRPHRPYVRCGGGSHGEDLQAVPSGGVALRPNRTARGAVRHQLADELLPEGVWDLQISGAPLPAVDHDVVAVGVTLRAAHEGSSITNR